MKKIYNYNSETFEYTGEEFASLDPKETMIQGHDVYLIPAYATDKTPPETTTNETVIFKNNAWQIIADYRGQYMVDETMQPQIVENFGDLPEGYVPITEKQAIKINEDNLYYIIQDGKLVKNPNYDEQQAQKRKDAFLQDFFQVEGYGYYRRQPKGYISAVESMTVLFNAALAMNGIQAGLIIFYPEPDFNNAEQCTEKWLVENQIIMPSMTKEEFFTLWALFTQAWNTQEHVK